MFGRKTLIAALCMYTLVLGCVVWPSGLATKTADGKDNRLVALEGLPYCGASMQLHDVNNVAGYEKACDEIAALGGDTVMFVPSAAMETGTSTRIYIDARETMSEVNLRELITHARNEKLRVILMPIVLLDAPINNEWRGTIHPDSWDAWFQSYQDMILFYAKIAQDTDVNVLVVGSELVSSEPYVDDWKTTIRKVRDVFHGHLTYSSNWDHYAMVQFWDKLDMVGMNSYWKLGPEGDSGVSTEEIERRWADIQKDLFTWQKTVNKPILLLEAGWCSLGNASYEPWDYTKIDLPLDLDLQRRLYQGFYESWWNKPECAGFMMWEWTPESPGGPDDKGYTPRGKPAADVMKEWFAKPRWAVH